jgi:WD40 repeat protein
VDGLRLEAGPVFFVAQASCLSLSGAEDLLAVGSRDKTVRVFDVKTQREVAVLAGHDHFVLSVSLSRDGKLLASAGKDRVIRIWDVAEKERIHSMKVEYEEPHVQFLGDSSLLAVSGKAEGVVIVDVKAKKVVRVLKCKRWDVGGLDATPDGRYLAAAIPQETRVWDLEGKEEYAIKESATAVALTEDGRTLATGEGLHIKLWDVRTGELKRKIAVKHRVLAVAITPRGGLVASIGSAEGRITLWDTASGRKVASMATWGPFRFGKGGRTLIAGGQGVSVRVWGLPGVD